jgi:hypothetical protein
VGTAAAATANDFVALEHGSDHLVGSMLVCGTKLVCIFSLSLSPETDEHASICRFAILLYSMRAS